MPGLFLSLPAEGNGIQTRLPPIGAFEPTFAISLARPARTSHLGCDHFLMSFQHHCTWWCCTLLRIQVSNQLHHALSSKFYILNSTYCFVTRNPDVQKVTQEVFHEAAHVSPASPLPSSPITSPSAKHT